jgi:hypothetical protein
LMDKIRARSRRHLRFRSLTPRAVLQCTYISWHRSRWLLLPPRGRRPVCGDPGKEKPLGSSAFGVQQLENRHKPLLAIDAGRQRGTTRSTGLASATIHSIQPAPVDSRYEAARTAGPQGQGHLTSDSFACFLYCAKWTSTRRGLAVFRK